jgi:hypothetical protein
MALPPIGNSNPILQNYQNANDANDDKKQTNDAANSPPPAARQQATPPLQPVPSIVEPANLNDNNNDDEKGLPPASGDSNPNVQNGQNSPEPLITTEFPENHDDVRDFRDFMGFGRIDMKYSFLARLAPYLKLEWFFNSHNASSFDDLLDETTSNKLTAAYTVVEDAKRGYLFTTGVNNEDILERRRKDLLFLDNIVTTLDGYRFDDAQPNYELIGHVADTIIDIIENHMDKI